MEEPQKHWLRSLWGGAESYKGEGRKRLEAERKVGGRVNAYEILSLFF